MCLGSSHPGRLLRGFSRGQQVWEYSEETWQVKQPANRPGPKKRLGFGLQHLGFRFWSAICQVRPYDRQQLSKFARPFIFALKNAYKAAVWGQHKGRLREPVRASDPLEPTQLGLCWTRHASRFAHPVSDPPAFHCTMIVFIHWLFCFDLF